MKISKFTASVLALAVTSAFSAQAADDRYIIKVDENKKGIVKYGEVKNFDSGSFFLSKYEYDFGLKNQKDYEIWLVKNKSEIFQIFDFFTNSKYIKNVSEYIIHLEIANN